MKPLNQFAHLIHSKVQFPQVASRASTSIVLLTFLLTGMVTPAGACALMCVRHQRAESQRHCGQSSEATPAMAHDDSAMNHPSVEAMGPGLVSQTCRTNCATAERLAVSRKVVPQVTSIQNGVVVLVARAKFLAPDPATSDFLDGTPPKTLSAYAAAFSILRI